MQGKVRDPAQRADDGTFFVGGLPRQPVRARRVSETVLDPTRRSLGDGFGADSVRLGRDAGRLLGTSHLGAHDRGSSGLGVNGQPRLFLS